MSTGVSFGRLLVIAVAALFSHAVPAATTACVPGPSERCADDRLAAEIAERLSPAELKLASHGKHHYTLALRVAADELIWSRVGSGSSDVEVRDVAAQMLIDSYLKTGLSNQALALFDALDPATQERITTGPIINGTYGEPDTLYVEVSPQLTAAELAVALADVGRKEEMHDLLLRAELPVDPGPKESWAGDLVWPSTIAGRCVRALVQTGVEMDWFAWGFGGGASSAMSPPCRHAARSRGFHRRAAAGLLGSGIPRKWLPEIDANDSPGSSNSDQDEIDVALAVLPMVRQRVAQLMPLLAEVDRIDASFLAREEEDAETTPDAVPPSERDRALAHLLAERLAAPIYNPFRAEAAPIAAPPPDAGARKAPCSRGVLRCHEADGVRWELRNSQDYDPTGEVPAAGFWLGRTEIANGARRAFYLGIKEHNPFVLVDQYDPLVHDGRLQLTVRRAEINASKLTFPPFGLQFEKSESLLRLSASIDDVVRDSDSDGLTDLAEQQLLLDPRKRDTDGDHVEDANDALPHVATNCPEGGADMMAVALNVIMREPDAGISMLVPESETLDERVSTAERTLFLQTDPESLGALCPAGRIVVLPNSLDMKLLRAHPSFAIFLPMRVSLRMIDEDHAELEFSSGWSGGTVALHRRDGIWRAAALENWVT